MIPPNGGYDQLPTITDTTPGADLSRIKYYRNFLAHLDDGRIDTTFFNTAWTDITGVCIGILFSENYFFRSKCQKILFGPASS